MKLMGVGGLTLFFKKFKYAFIENILIDGLIFIVFFQMNPLKENFLNMNIHPLLIVVSLTALRYGNYIGLISAFMSSITYIIGYLALGRDLYLLIVDFDYYKFILMFFLAAIIFGRFKDNYDFKIKNKNMEYDLLKKDNEDLKSEYEKLKFIKEELRKQIVGAEYSITSLYEIASTLETLDSEDIYTEVMHILEKFLKAKSMSIYTIDEIGGFLRLKLKKGEDKIIPNSIVANDHKYITKLLKEKKVIKNNMFNQTEQNNYPLMSGPILKDNKVIAIVNIENMDFDMITEYSYNLFKVIIDWINKALVQALEVELEANKQKFYIGTRIMKYEFFNNRLQEEIERRERYDMDFALIKFYNKILSIEQLEEIFKKSIRQVDVVAYDEINKTVYLLLPTTQISSSLKVQERVLNASYNDLELIKYEDK